MHALCTIPLFAMDKTPLQELTENMQLSTTTADVSGQSAIQEKINAELKQQLNASQHVDQLIKLSEEVETFKRRLANFELAFSDVLQQVEDLLCNLETARNLLSELENAGLKPCSEETGSMIQQVEQVEDLLCNQKLHLIY